MEELYQKGMELWETAEQLIKQHKIASSEGRSTSWAITIIITEKTATKIKRHLNGTARPLNRDMLEPNMNLVSYVAMD